MRLTSILFATLAAATLAAPAMAQSPGDPAPGDPAAGATAFKKCMACHAVGPGAKNKIGPELNGVMGRAVASVEGYAFSPAMKAHVAEVPVWDEAAMTAWLTNPKLVVAKTKMAFPGIKKPEEIANIIAYMKTFDASGAPVAN